jgi:hypothetical protein
MATMAVQKACRHAMRVWLPARLAFSLSFFSRHTSTARTESLIAFDWPIGLIPVSTDIYEVVYGF